MFTDFMLHLRSVGLKVSLQEWLSVVEALSKGFARSNLNRFYTLSRSLLVKDEAKWDLFDRAFEAYFKGIEHKFDIDDELMSWLANPKMPRPLTDAERAALEALDLDEVRRRFEERLQEQKERHDGGNRWVGTGGTSPFGHGGSNPAGVRVGGSGGGRSAIQIAGERRFANLRTDRILDTRQIGVALRRLKKLGRIEGALELDLPATIDKSAKEAGEIELVFGPPRKNRVKLMLLLDVGGSMDPHANLCERVFSAAHAATHFQAFSSYFFHNCPYETVYTDMWHGKGKSTLEVLREIDQSWCVVFVGDAWMSPYELTHTGGAISYNHLNDVPGIEWLKRFKERAPRTIWLNPEPERIWGAQSISMIRSLFSMYPLTIDGMTRGVDELRGVRRA